jgi:Eukaryotic translation initiation factor 3 subunit 8 N-terminus
MCLKPAEDEAESSDSEADAKSAGEAAEDAFEKIKSRQEKKRDKLYTMDPTQITYDMVTKKLREIVTTRGKKGVDRSEQVGEAEEGWHRRFAII